MVQMEDTVFAPMFWGFVASIFLAGITVVQAYVYFMNQRDGALIRWTAACMLIMDMASSALIAQSIYFYLIPEFGSFEPLQSVTPELTVDCLISATITFISQLYFVHQLVAVRRVGKGHWFAIWVTLVSAVLGFAGGLGCVGAMFKYHKSILASSGRSVMFKILFSLAKGWAALADIVATVAMCLWLTSSKAFIKETNSILSELNKWVVQRGILVTTIQVLLLIAFYSAPGSLAWFALHMNVTKLYANTFFAMLNGRTHLREKQSGAFTSGAGGGSSSTGGGGPYHSGILNQVSFGAIGQQQQQLHRSRSGTMTKSSSGRVSVIGSVGGGFELDVKEGGGRGGMGGMIGGGGGGLALVNGTTATISSMPESTSDLEWSMSSMEVDRKGGGGMEDVEMGVKGACGADAVNGYVVDGVYGGNEGVEMDASRFRSNSAVSCTSESKNSKCSKAGAGGVKQVAMPMITRTVIVADV